MKTKRLIVVPKCDVCKAHVAEYDAPTAQGPWAYMCQTCYTIHASAIAHEVGCKLALKPTVEKTNTDKKVRANEVWTDDYLTSILSDQETRSPECPLCGDARDLEIDAEYFNCSCGARVLCPTPY